ncbi:hypothetical protein HBB16_16565 [Pseudonocardia sp. MCCB 268]|nr:hypothetical protein [Pseudonocardia cytotoxica]
MTASAKQFADFAKRGGTSSPSRPHLDRRRAGLHPDPRQSPSAASGQRAGTLTVDRVFDFYEQVLGQQVLSVPFVVVYFNLSNT